MKSYKHIFFDLDHTLWDFETNVQEAMYEVITLHGIATKVGNFSAFYVEYRKHNNRLWASYRNGKIKKDELSWKRFDITLRRFGVKDTDLAKQIACDFLNNSATKTQLFPKSIQTLQYLKEKDYKLHIITNGFVETQYKKLKNSKIIDFFDAIITSEEAGAMKPDARIFYHALQKAQAERNNSLMIGDDPLSDIQGAKNVGIDQVLFNPQRINYKVKSTFHIFQLNQLTSIL